MAESQTEEPQIEEPQNEEKKSDSNEQHLNSILDESPTFDIS